MTGLPDTTVAELGAALYAARRSRIPIEPLTDAHPAMTMRDAYRVQRDVLARLLAGPGDYTRPVLPAEVDRLDPVTLRVS